MGSKSKFMARPKKQAKSLIDQAFGGDGVDSIDPENDLTDESFEVEPEIEHQKTGVKLIIQEVRVDKFNVKRSRVELTPAVCPICAFDLLDKFKKNYADLKDGEKTVVAEAMIRHKAQFHTVADQRIIDSSELPKEYLARS